MIVVVTMPVLETRDALATVIAPASLVAVARLARIGRMAASVAEAVGCADVLGARVALVIAGPGLAGRSDSFAHAVQAFAVTRRVVAHLAVGVGIVAYAAHAVIVRALIVVRALRAIVALDALPASVTARAAVLVQFVSAGSGGLVHAPALVRICFVHALLSAQCEFAVHFTQLPAPSQRVPPSWLQLLLEGLGGYVQVWSSSPSGSQTFCVHSLPSSQGLGRHASPGSAHTPALHRPSALPGVKSHTSPLACGWVHEPLADVAGARVAI